MQIYIFNRKEYQQVLKTLPRIKVSRIIMQIKNIPTIFTDGWYKGNLHTSAFTPIQGKKIGDIPLYKSPISDIFRKHSLYGYSTHKGIVAHIELYFVLKIKLFCNIQI